MKWLNDLLTGADNKTHDIGRWFAALSGSTGIGMPVYDTVMNHAHFNVQEFGIGMAALAGGVGALLRLKQDTEPKP